MGTPLTPILTSLWAQEPQTAAKALKEKRGWTDVEAEGWESGQPGVTAPLTHAGMGSRANIPSKNIRSQTAYALHCPPVCLVLFVLAVGVKIEEKGKRDP